MMLAAAANHLWQSTLVAAAIALATLALRRNHASVRHALWLAASAKFLVPFAALIALGSALGPLTPVPLRQRGVTIVVDFVGEPLVTDLPERSPAPAVPRSGSVVHSLEAFVIVLWGAGALVVLATSWRRRRRIASLVRASAAIEDGPEIAVLRRLERRAGLSRPIAVVRFDDSIEPGIFGIARPVLLWPSAIAERLTAEQASAILAHEVAHVRRRDNFAAALHGVVEAVFWFHPLVWWIGARLIDERERACDEEVVRGGGEPALYAESILTACRVFVEAPRAWVAGVTGSDLSSRIERIMRGHTVRRLSVWTKVLLAAVAVATIMVPVGLGALNAPYRRPARPAQTAAPSPLHFEVAAIKPNKSGPGPVRIETNPGGRFNATNVTLKYLVQFAYRLQAFQVVGGPDWLTSDRFDIVAKGDDENGSGSIAEPVEGFSRTQLMLQTLLAERFKLIVRIEQKEQPTYSMVLARSDHRLGASLSPSKVDCTVEAERRAQSVVKSANGPEVPCGIRMGMGSLAMGGATLSQLARSLSNMLDRTVLDRTGLTGTFDATLKFTPDQSTPGFAEKAKYIPSIDPNGPSIFTALQEQLGLKLDAAKGQLDLLHIVSADQPTPN
jgi:bla regulator protein blaR1